MQLDEKPQLDHRIAERNARSEEYLEDKNAFQKITGRVGRTAANMVDRAYTFRGDSDVSRWSGYLIGAMQGLLLAGAVVGVISLLNFAAAAASMAAVASTPVMLGIAVVTFAAATIIQGERYHSDAMVNNYTAEGAHKAGRFAEMMGATRDPVKEMPSMREIEANAKLRDVEQNPYEGTLEKTGDLQMSLLASQLNSAVTAKEGNQEGNPKLSHTQALERRRLLEQAAKKGGVSQ